MQRWSIGMVQLRTGELSSFCRHAVRSQVVVGKLPAGRFSRIYLFLINTAKIVGKELKLILEIILFSG